jgi:hypothetical protein
LNISLRIIHRKWKKLNDLAEKIPQIADGTYQLPEPPSLKKEASINVQVTKQGEKERGR